MNEKEKFNSGDVIVFEPNNFNKNFWDGLSEEDRLKYYGSLGYGQSKLKLFIYVCPINNAEGYDSGHHVMIDMDTSLNHIMRHTSDFRKATDDEF